MYGISTGHKLLIGAGPTSGTCIYLQKTGSTSLFTVAASTGNTGVGDPQNPHSGNRCCHSVWTHSYETFIAYTVEVPLMSNMLILL